MTWKQLPGLGTDIAIGAEGSAWVIGTNPVQGGFGIYRWDGGNWIGVDGGAVRIAVGPDGTPWVVNDAGQIYHRSGSSWQLLPGAAKDVAVGADGTVWVVGTNAVPGGYGIYKWTGSNWAAVDGGGVRIAVDPHGRPWVLNDTGAIFKRVDAQPGTPEHWERIPTGLATDIAISPHGFVWLIGTDNVDGGHGIYYWGGADWYSVEGGGLAIAADPSDNPWVVNDASVIWEGVGIYPT